MPKPIVGICISGGVDSAVASYLLKSSNKYEIIGIFFQAYEYDGVCNFKPSNCCSPEALKIASTLATTLKIPFFRINLSEYFKKYIIQDFIMKYSNGLTPNPCVLCNNYIKFGILLNLFHTMGINYIATGHYAKIIFDKKLNRYVLKQSDDLIKDQSYFLAGLTQEQLKRIIFPLQNYTKVQVKNLAKELKLISREESQEICFVNNGDYRKFLTKFIEPVSGNILDTSGKIIGKHKGIFFYTIGQRKGLGIAKGYPLYVIKIDSKNNEIVVGSLQELLKKRFRIKNFNLISKKELKSSEKLLIKIRHNFKPAPGVLDKSLEKAEFLVPQLAITPGQYAVFYQNDTVIGGAEIVADE